MGRVNFYYQKNDFPFKNRRGLKAVIEEIFLKNKKQLSGINYIFCTDSYLLEINRQFLNHDFYTDIITFDMSGHKKEITGEVYISIDRVIENANIHRESFSRELHRVIFHGALHLCGFKDKKPSDKKKMRTQEEKWLFYYFHK